MSLINNLTSMVDINDLKAELLELTPNTILRDVEHVQLDLTIPAKSTNDNYYVLTFNNSYMSVENVSIINSSVYPLFIPGEY